MVLSSVHGTPGALALIMSHRWPPHRPLPSHWPFHRLGGGGHGRGHWILELSDVIWEAGHWLWSLDQRTVALPGRAPSLHLVETVSQLTHSVLHMYAVGNLCEGEGMTVEMTQQGTEGIIRGDHRISFVLLLILC